MLQCLMNDGKILACGNGGSAADAQHFTAEMTGRLKKSAWIGRCRADDGYFRLDRHRQRLRFSTMCSANKCARSDVPAT